MVAILKNVVSDRFAECNLVTHVALNMRTANLITVEIWSKFVANAIFGKNRNSKNRNNKQLATDNRSST